LKYQIKWLMIGNKQNKLMMIYNFGKLIFLILKYKKFKKKSYNNHNNMKLLNHLPKN